jgi:acyl-coenzyme A synthetase/AMP-(fatty) acid ligase
MKKFFWENLKEFENNTALTEISSGKSLNYSELDKITDDIAERLITKHKKLIFLFTSNDIQSVVAYISVLKSGDSVLLLDKKINDEIRTNLVSLYKPHLILNLNEPLEGYTQVENATELNFLKCITENESIIHPSLKILLSTSGTTGSPKLVRLSADNIQSNAEAIAQYLEIDDKENPITTLPFNYSYGLSVINSHLLKGANIFLTDKTVFFKDFWNDFKNHKCTSFAGVPYTYQMLKRIGFDKLELPTLKTMTQAGGKLNEEMIKFFADYASRNNVKFFVMYGQTEATARISYVPHNKLKEKIGSIGIAIPGGKLSLYFDGLKIKAPNTIGEIVYEGENVMLGYAEALADLSKGDELAGKLFTGDLGYKDEDGYFYITGRMKRFIKMFGLRINLDEVQKMIENTFHIASACTGEDEKLRILIQASENFEAKVKQKVCEFYKLNPSTVSIKSADEIPTKSTGKYDYEKINELFS